MTGESPAPADVAPTGRTKGGPLRRLLTVLLIAAAFGFLAFAVARDWGQLRAHDWTVRPATLALSILPLLGAFVIGVYTWARTLDKLEGGAAPFPALLRIWFLSTLARYIPGKVWQFVGAAQLAREAGLSAPLLLTSLVVSMGFNVLAAGVLGAAALPGGVLIPETLRPTVLFAVLIVAAIGVHPAFLNFCLRLVPRWLHRTVLVWRGGWAYGVRLLLISVAGWIAYGAGFWLFVRALTPVHTDALFPLAGVNAVAFLAGYLVFIAPAGLGARELSMAALLQPILAGGAGVAAVIAIASRLWVVAAEVLGAGALLLFGGGNGAAATATEPGATTPRTGPGASTAAAATPADEPPPALTFALLTGLLERRLDGYAPGPLDGARLVYSRASDRVRLTWTGAAFVLERSEDEGWRQLAREPFDPDEDDEARSAEIVRAFEVAL